MDFVILPYNKIYKYYNLYIGYNLFNYINKSCSIDKVDYTPISLLETDKRQINDNKCISCNKKCICENKNENKEYLDKNIKKITFITKELDPEDIYCGKYIKYPINFNINTFDINDDKFNINLCMSNCEFDIIYKLPDEEEEVMYHITCQEDLKIEGLYNKFNDYKFSSIKIQALNKHSFTNINKFSECIYKFTKSNILDLLNSNNTKIYYNEEYSWNELKGTVKRSVDTIYLPKELKQNIIDDINWFLEPSTKQKYMKYGRNYKRTYLFEGIPGSGKTSFIKALAGKYNYSMSIINFSQKITDSTLIELIKTINTKSFLVFEDIDTLFEERKKNDDMRNNITFSGLLNMLDGIITPNNLICFITTNIKSNLDSALLRTGRIDKIYKFENINKQQLHDIYKVYMDDKFNIELFEKFYKLFKSYNINVSVSLIQEYLFKYIENPTGAETNIDELKQLYDNSNKNNPEFIYN